LNELRPHPPDRLPQEWDVVVGWDDIRRAYADYLHDESRLAAPRLEKLHFPADAGQVAAALRSAFEGGHRVAVSGGRTGITGAAVPIGAEEMISLERLKPRPVVRRSGAGNWTVRVGAGITLRELSDALDHRLCDYPDGMPDRALFYPVDTTELTAQIGGTVATNASGARTLHYGPTRDWVEALTIVTPDGRLVELRRGQVTAEDGQFVYVRADGGGTRVPVPDLPMPPTKHTAGYYLKHGMDAVDLFVGSEGTLGIVVEAELRLAEKPSNRLFLTQFVDGPEQAVRLAAACKAHPALEPLALEYIGPRAMEMMRRMGRSTSAYVEVERLPADVRAAVYIELPFADEAGLDGIYGAVCEVLDSVGLDASRSWAGFTDGDAEEMKRLRHAVPETVNAIIGRRKARSPELHKVGTDMAVPDESLPEMMRIYEEKLAASGLEFVIFGHIGNGHLHANILPSDAGQMQQGERLYLEFAREAVRLGGSVAAEHGIGRIKKKLLPIQYGPEHLAAMRAVKGALDPDWALNPGVLFER